MILLRRITLFMLNYNILVKTLGLPGEHNALCDAPFYQPASVDLLTCFNMEQLPTSV